MKLEPIDLQELVAELDSMVADNPLGEDASVATEEGGSFVLFLVGSCTYAVSVDSVAAVLLVPNLCEVPHAPSWLDGVFYWGGGVVPLLSAAVLDGLLDATESGQGRARSGDEDEYRAERCLVLACSEVKVAVRVEEVFGVHRLSPTPGGSDDGKDHQTSDSAKVGSGNLSEALRWQMVASGGAEGEASKQSPLQDSGGGAPSSPEGGGAVVPDGPIRVLSLVGLLASEKVSRYANLSALDLALAGGSTKEPYGSGRS